MSLAFDQALDFSVPLDKIRQNLLQNQDKFFKLPLQNSFKLSESNEQIARLFAQLEQQLIEKIKLPNIDD